jgi:hypothetical protein
MKLLLKILSVPFIAFTACFSFGLGFVPLIEGYHPLYPLIDTYHSKDYSIQKFDLIKIGYAEKSVILLVGPPLYESNDTLLATRTLYFTADGRLLEYSNRNNEYEDFAWYRSSVTLDNKNRVIKIDKGWSHD